jgi:hypothetical protein
MRKNLSAYHEKDAVEGAPIFLRCDGLRGQETKHCFRIAAPREADMVEVSINQGAWKGCRQEGVFWLAEWSGVELCEYALRARMLVGKNGKAATTYLHLVATPRLDKAEDGHNRLSAIHPAAM